MRNIVLIGMPGSGKTTVARALSAALGRPFSDADALAAMLESDGILLGVVVDHTDREGLARICRIAVDHSVPILGYLAAGGAANE